MILVTFYDIYYDHEVIITFSNIFIIASSILTALAIRSRNNNYLRYNFLCLIVGYIFNVSGRFTKNAKSIEFNTMVNLYYSTSTLSLVAPLITLRFWMRI
jgi:hypothetical protein